MKSTKESAGRLDRLITFVTVATATLAICQELRKPAGDRTWHGVLFGWLPYDFRRPTMRRLRETFWAPADPRLLVPRFFGVGWDVNLGRIASLVRGRRHGLDGR